METWKDYEQLKAGGDIEAARKLAAKLLAEKQAPMADSSDPETGSLESLGKPFDFKSLPLPKALQGRDAAPARGMTPSEIDSYRQNLHDKADTALVMSGMPDLLEEMHPWLCETEFHYVTNADADFQRSPAAAEAVQRWKDTWKAMGHKDRHWMFISQSTPPWAGFAWLDVHSNELDRVSVFEVHDRWHELPESERPAHPLLTLVKAWQERPEVLEPETHATRIMPKGLLPHTPSAVYVYEERHDLDTLPLAGLVEESQPELPLFPVPEATDRQRRDPDDLPAVTPLFMADVAGFGGLTLGRGARIDKRLLIFSLLIMTLHQRRPGGQYVWRPALRELVHAYQGGPGLLWNKGTWQPGRNARQLTAAFNAVTLATVRLQDGRTWLPVVARGRPNPYDLDSEAWIEIELPEFSDRGPALDFPALVEYGKVSDPAFDLWLSLAYLWDDAKAGNGGFRIYATRPEARRNKHGHLVTAKGDVVLGHPENPFTHKGKLLWKPGTHPQTDWRHPQAVLIGQERHPQADKMRWLHPEARRRLAYGLKPQDDTGNRTHERQNADGLIKRLEAQGRVVIETDGPYWRILEKWRDSETNPTL